MLSTPGASLAVGKGWDGEGLPHIRHALCPPHPLLSYTAGSPTQSTVRVWTRKDKIRPLPLTGRDYRKESKRIFIYCSYIQKEGSERATWVLGLEAMATCTEKSRAAFSPHPWWGRAERNWCELHGGPPAAASGKWVYGDLHQWVVMATQGANNPWPSGH